MQTTQDKSAINRMLQSHGLGRLEDGAGLMAQLGFLVQDHEHLRFLLSDMIIASCSNVNCT